MTLSPSSVRKEESGKHMGVWSSEECVNSRRKRKVPLGPPDPGRGQWLRAQAGWAAGEEDGEGGLWDF